MARSWRVIGDPFLSKRLLRQIDAAKRAGQTPRETVAGNNDGMMMLDLGQGGVQMPSMLIYKVFRAPEWLALQDAGETRGAPVDLEDGFVHFSTGSQLAETVSRHFRDEGDLMLLACEAEALGAALRWERSRGGEHFPHLYRPLRLDDVLWARPLPLAQEGHDIGDLT